MMLRPLLLILFLAVFSGVCAATHDAGIALDSRSERITVQYSKLHLGSAPGHGGPVGPWPFGGSRVEDLDFYGSEDAKYTTWEEWKVLLLQNENEEAERKKKQSSMEGKGNDQPLVARLAVKTAVANKDSFSDRTSARRKMEFFRVIAKNTTTIAQKMKSFQSLTTKVRHLVHPTQIFPPQALQDSGSLEFHYNWFLENSLSHTIIPPDTGFLASLVMLRVLPPLMLMDQYVIDAVEAEAQSIRYNLKLMLVSPRSPELQDSVAANELKDQQDQMKDDTDYMLQTAAHSRRALRGVHAMSFPIIQSLQKYLERTISDMEKELLRNDEATEAKRQRAKLLSKEKGGLLALQHRIIAVTRDMNAADYKEKLISPHSFTVGLALIAKFRLNLSSGFADIDNLPELDDFVAGLGLQHDEFMFRLVFPLCVGAFFSVVVALLVDEVRRYSIRVAIQSKSEIKLVEQRRALNRNMRYLFRLLFFIKSVAFLALPLVATYYANHRAPISLRDIVSFITPSQRAAFALVWCFFYTFQFIFVVLTSKIHSSVRPAPRVVSASESKKSE